MSLSASKVAKCHSITTSSGGFDTKVICESTTIYSRVFSIILVTASVRIHTLYDAAIISLSILAIAFVYCKTD